MKKIILGLVASGKTTLFRKLNEERVCNAVEIELPQSCIDDEELKKQLLNLYLNNDNIDCIIAHPYYLPKGFKYNFEYLDVPIEERKRRSIQRSLLIDSNCVIFGGDFFEKEEEYLKKLKEENNI